MTGKKPAIQDQGLNEEIFRSVFDNAPIGKCLVSLEGRFLKVNSAFCHMLGYSESELLSMTFVEVTHPDDISASNEWVRNLLSGKSTSIDLEKRYLHKTGNVVWGIVRSFLLRDAIGHPLFFSTSIQDITDRKQAEKALQQSEEKYRDLFENAIDPIVILDAEHNFVDMNKRALELFGYSREEFLQMKVFDIIPSEQVAASKEEFEKLHTKGKYEKFVGKIRTKDGRWLDIEVSSSAIVKNGKIIGSRDIIRDITERKKTEENLYLNKYMIDNIQEMILWVDPEAHFVFVNDHTCRTLGYTREELLYMTVHDIDPNFPEEVWPQHWENIKQSGRARTIETIALHKNGRRIPIEVVINYLNFFGKEFHCCFVHDITERKKAEEILKESEDRFRILLDKGFDGIFIHRDLIILDMNQRMADISGYSPSELLQSNVINLFTPDSQKSIHNYISSGQKGYYEVKLLRKEGQIVDIEAFGAPCKFHGRGARIVAIRDITEQKKLHEQLRQAQKMEAIGHLAGGVAHDFNNILSAIVGYAHLTLLKLKDDDPLRMNIEEILTASDKAANLTQSLLAFSRKQLIVSKPVSINSIVFNMKKILDRIIGEDIDFKVINNAVNDLIVKVDKGQIEHVLMNLATNARDAMPDGGKLTITTEEINIDEHFIRMHQEGEIGKYAVITVTDTGVGMDKKTRENIFEPFFTTKEVGKGTGLGLAMVYGTIKQHNGFINVYSEQGKGTTFNIYLPLAESVVEHMGKNEEAPVASGNEKILLIEDDQDVRRSIKSLLEEFGHTVIEAADGDQAITLFSKNKDFFQLVISDVIMPRQSGKEVYDELKKIRPDIKILFVSGYSADILTKKGIVGEGINFISKPINPEVFFRKIREVLDK
jgi:PAS domain S-box-containing protein